MLSEVFKLFHTTSYCMKLDYTNPAPIQVSYWPSSSSKDPSRSLSIPLQISAVGVPGVAEQRYLYLK